VFYSRDFIESVRAFAVLGGNLVFLFLIINTVRSWPLVKLSVQLWLLASVLVGLYTMYDWHFGNVLESARIGISQTRYDTAYSDHSEYTELRVVKRAMGPTSHPSVYGINMILTIPFFFHLLRSHQRILWKMACWGGLSIVLYNIFLTNTRATLAGALIALVFSAFFKLYRIRLREILALGILFALMLPLIPEDVALRLMNVSNYTVGHSRTLAVRMDYWQTFLKIAKDHWLGGIGVGEKITIAEHVTNADAPSKTSVHNDFMATFLDVGIFGWLFFIAFLASILRTTRKAALRYKALPNGMEPYWFLSATLVATLSTIFYGLQCDVFHLPLKGWWLVVGLSMGISQLGNPERDRPPGLVCEETPRVLDVQPGIPTRSH
jgi:hypothetical protein